MGWEEVVSFQDPTPWSQLKSSIPQSLEKPFSFIFLDFDERCRQTCHHQFQVTLFPFHRLLTWIARFKLVFAQQVLVQVGRFLLLTPLPLLHLNHLQIYNFDQQEFHVLFISKLILLVFKEEVISFKELKVTFSRALTTLHHLLPHLPLLRPLHHLHLHRSFILADFTSCHYLHHLNVQRSFLMSFLFTL